MITIPYQLLQIYEKYVPRFDRHNFGATVYVSQHESVQLIHGHSRAVITCESEVLKNEAIMNIANIPAQIYVLGADQGLSYQRLRGT